VAAAGSLRVIEEEEPRPKPSAPWRDLRPMGVAELEAYIQELKAEIGRVEGELAKRRDVRGAAEALFKRPPGRA
jgi:uncharacterized small protein (DUF1192 family)